MKHLTPCRVTVSNSRKYHWKLLEPQYIYRYIETCILFKVCLSTCLCNNMLTIIWFCGKAYLYVLWKWSFQDMYIHNVKTVRSRNCNQTDKERSATCPHNTSPGHVHLEMLWIFIFPNSCNSLSLLMLFNKRLLFYSSSWWLQHWRSSDKPSRVKTTSSIIITCNYNSWV